MTTKKEKLARLTTILDSHDLGSEVIGSPRSFLLEMCLECERYRKLAGDPSAQFFIGNYKIASGRKVRMVFLSSCGKKVPVSKTNLFPTKKRSEEVNYVAQVRDAMRKTVDDQISEFRSSLPFKFTCQESGLTLRKDQKYDVDHWGKPFIQLADDWLLSEGVTYDDIVLCGPMNHKKIKDPDLSLSWAQYHSENCILTPLHPSANRSKGCGDYTSPESLLRGQSVANAAVSLDF